MNNCILDNNRKAFHFINQKFEPSFSFENADIEYKIEKNDTTFEKQLLFNKFSKEKDIYKYKEQNGNNQIVLDTISDNYNNYHLNTTNENFISRYFEELNNPINKEMEKNLDKNNIIFRIAKINRKIGRIKKNSRIKGIHDRLSEDNIIRKIKGRFIEKLRLYLNEEYQKYISKNLKNNKKKVYGWLKKINPTISRKIKKEDNLKWFESKIYEIFSENLSLKYSSYSLDSNKKKIKRIISSNNAKNVKDILNNKVEYLFDKYINNEKVEGFKTLKDDLKELETHMESTGEENIKEYLNKYEYIAKNMKNIFKQKNPRNIIHKK